MKFSSNFAATLTLYTLQKHVQSGARCTTQSDARIQTLLWFGSSQVVFVCGRRICAAVCWGHRFAQWFSTASKELGVQYAQVCSKHLFKQSVIEVKTLGIIRLLHVSICFIWIDHSACFFSWKGLSQEMPQVLVSEAILRTGSRETARPLFALWLQLLRSARREGSTQLQLMHPGLIWLEAYSWERTVLPRVP